MFRLPRSIGPLFVLLLGLAACDLPQGAAVATQVVKGAGDPAATFALHYVSRENLPTLKSWPITNPGGTQGWIAQKAGPSGQIIQAGDRVSLVVWDNEESSLLTTPAQKVITLPNLKVSQDGTVFLPYADEVYIAKMTPDEARLAIQQKLTTIVPSAQVELAHEVGRESAIDLVSGVNRPGSFPLPDRNFTILSAIAQGGGVDNAIITPQIRLQRDGKLYGMSLDRLLKNPDLDTTMRGGDKIYVQDEERYFLSLGAAAREAPIPFPQDYVTALDAMSLIGGLNDTRANAKGILILRDYSDKAVRSDGTGPDKDRVVFAIDLTTADGLFSAGEFPIQHRDLVLVTESPISNTNTVFALIGTVLGLATKVQDF